MPFMFSNYPKVQYDFKKNGNYEIITNVLVRFKIASVLQNLSAIYYDYVVQEGERPDTIASKYYGDGSLDWVILTTNFITDPHFDWPLDYRSFNEFLRGKYGSVEYAQRTIHSYEQIINQGSVLFDGTIIPEQYITVDKTTYDTLSFSERRIIYVYDYENRLNEDRRRIKLLDEQYIPALLNQKRIIFD